MTQEELIKEIKQLPDDRQREILDVITRIVQEQAQSPEDRSAIVSRLRGIAKPEDWVSDTQAQVGGDGQLSISQRLYGILQFEGGPPTDDEVKNMISDHLLEKYS
jgi:hypothetical protein